MMLLAYIDFHEHVYYELRWNLDIWKKIGKFHQIKFALTKKYHDTNHNKKNNTIQTVINITLNFTK